MYPDETLQFNSRCMYVIYVAVCVCSTSYISSWPIHSIINAAVVLCVHAYVFRYRLSAYLSLKYTNIIPTLIKSLIYKSKDYLLRLS